MSDGPEATRLLEALRLVGRALDDSRHPWALVGGLSVSVLWSFRASSASSAGSLP
jgi:hypothetical protein